MFVPGDAEVDEASVAAYVRGLEPDAQRYGVHVGEPRNQEDDWIAFLELLHQERPPVVSFTFGCPSPAIVGGLRELGISVWMTITQPAEAILAQEAGADGLVVQGIEAGGHRGGFDDGAQADGLGVLALLRLTAATCKLPLIAAGGIADGPALAAVLAGGATAAQIGTAFMLADEAATHAAHRAALATDSPTGLTRAFSGRQARGIVNRF